jgi:hypothetical protein
MPVDTRIKSRVQKLQEGTEEKGLYAVVSPGNVVRIEERERNQGSPCTCDYSRCVVGPDGVARLGLPSGHTREVKGCVCTSK